MKIISRKKWEEINSNYVDLQLEYNSLYNDNQTYKSQVDTIVTINSDLSFKITELENKLNDAKKEIRKLRNLCTKNKVNYKEQPKKEDKKACKKAKK